MQEWIDDKHYLIYKGKNQNVSYYSLYHYSDKFLASFPVFKGENSTKKKKAHEVLLQTSKK
jgi:hypothetical protein